ncbi:MAG: asparaginyl/glutamyl-tRNA amidotransferase subunit C [Candidatus Margulisbacteria bacterium GWF2_35_9]|nr:MAG: asparaginyl/glutamyl-tRNA amidotransferase subunit C [Candidatus Margulisbacteria bacterium GWF2_35_9]
MITKETIKHLAVLSRLEFTEKQLDNFSHDLENIFNYAQMLNEVDTTGIIPSSHAMPLQNVFKEDRVIPYHNIEKIMANAPLEESHAFRVPKILAD